MVGVDVEDPLSGEIILRRQRQTDDGEKERGET